MKTEVLDESTVVEIRMLRYDGFSIDTILEHISLNYRDAEGQPLKLKPMTIRRLADGTTYKAFGGPRTSPAHAIKKRKERAKYA